MTSQKTNWPLVILLWLSGIAAAMQFAKISVTFNALQTHYASTPSDISLVLSLPGLIGLFLAASASLLIQRWGYKRMLLCALLLGAILSFAQAQLPSLPALYAMRFVEGLSHLAVVVAAPTLMATATAPQQRSLVMSMWGTFFGVAFTLANTFAPAWLAHFGLPSLFVAHGAILLVLAAALWWALDKHLIASSTQAISLRGLLERHKHIYGQFNTVLPSLVFICYTSMYVALMTFLPQLGGGTDAWVMVALPLISIAGAFIAGALVQNGLSSPNMVKLAFAFVLLSVAALAVADAQGWNLNACKMAVFLGMGLQQGAIYGMIPYLAKSSEQQAQSIAAIAQMGNLGSTAGPPLFALAFGAGASAGLISLSAFITAAGLLLMWLAFRKRV
ncbi:MAG: MFS transporter [Formosimonas sp.]